VAEAALTQQHGFIFTLAQDASAIQALAPELA
jgi:hypothetical protein